MEALTSLEVISVEATISLEPNLLARVRRLQNLTNQNLNLRVQPRELRMSSVSSAWAWDTMLRNVLIGAP